MSELSCHHPCWTCIALQLDTHAENPSLSGMGDLQRDSRESIRVNHSILKPLLFCLFLDFLAAHGPWVPGDSFETFLAPFGPEGSVAGQGSLTGRDNRGMIWLCAPFRSSSLVAVCAFQKLVARWRNFLSFFFCGVVLHNFGGFLFYWDFWTHKIHFKA